MLGTQLDCAVLDELVKRKLPTVYKHLEALGMPVQLVVMEWLLTVMTSTLPIRTSFRVLDVVMLSGATVAAGGTGVAAGSAVARKGLFCVCLAVLHMASKVGVESSGARMCAFPYPYIIGRDEKTGSHAQSRLLCRRN